MVSFILLLAVSEFSMDKPGLLAASSGWDALRSYCRVFFVACRAEAIAITLNSGLLEKEALLIQFIVCGGPYLQCF